MHYATRSQVGGHYIPYVSEVMQNRGQSVCQICLGLSGSVIGLAHVASAEKLLFSVRGRGAWECTRAMGD